MQNNFRATEQLTVQLVDSSAMHWAVVQNGNRIHEGSFEMCENFLDWHDNHVRMQSETAVSAEAVNVSCEDKSELDRTALLDSLLGRPDSVPARPSVIESCPCG